MMSPNTEATGSRKSGMALPPLMLEIQTGKHKGRRVRLVDAEVIVGRGEEATIRISSAEVSREHCKLIPELASGQVRVLDLKSRNGTFVDGRPVNGEKVLKAGGTLTVGPLTFLLVGKEEPVAASKNVALKGKVAASDGARLSDDEIAGWLSDYEIPTISANSPTDTAILKKSDSSSAIPQNALSDSQQPPASLLSGTQSGQSKRREFRSVAEEAEDIIRRHFEKIALEEQTAE